ncbi:unnamed protein product [Protopolystoma xenopodis]|uniref:Uncharacterized protein n=1 Tax=Protopolystoma xenopodis TaxID=117903 RepID=A0A3S5CI11_9PLAT|nr:unnamed protein product [Protopolystoma xenopodis]
MGPSSDDVHHMMNESSACFHLKRGRRPRGLHQPERRIKAKRLQYNGVHPSSSDTPPGHALSAQAVRKIIIGSSIFQSPVHQVSSKEYAHSVPDLGDFPISG